MANIADISKRAQNLILAGRLIDNDQEDGLKLSLHSDKTLQISLGKKVTQPELLMAEVINFFVIKRGYEHFSPISFREVESFLRDQNNIVTFKNPKEWESEMMSFQFFFQGKLQSLLNNKTDKFSRSGLNEVVQKGSLVDQNAYFFELCELLSLDLVLYKDGVLTLSGISEGDYKQYLDVFLAGFFNDGEKALPMKVVAV